MGRGQNDDCGREAARSHCELSTVFCVLAMVRSNLQLPTVFLPLAWRPRRDSNPRHSVPKTDALPLSYTGTPPHILARAPPLWAGFLCAQLTRQHFPKKRVDTPLSFCKNGSVAWSHAFGANRAKKRSGKRRVPLHHRTTTIVISMYFSFVGKIHISCFWWRFVPLLPRTHPKTSCRTDELLR